MVQRDTICQIQDATAFVLCWLIRLVPLALLYLFILYCCSFTLGIIFLFIGGGFKRSRKYSKFDTKHYTREGEFSVFWHKKYSKKYIEFPQV